MSQQKFTLSPDGRVFVISPDGKRLVEKPGARFIGPPATKVEVDPSSLDGFFDYFQRIAAEKGWTYHLEFAQIGPIVSPGIIVHYNGLRTRKHFQGELQDYVREFVFTGSVILAEDTFA